MEEDFSPGDVVELKSGGPKMTIENVGKYGMGATHDSANCVWFERMKRMEGVFELHMLRKVKDPTPPPLMRSDYPMR